MRFVQSHSVSFGTRLSAFPLLFLALTTLGCEDEGTSCCIDSSSQAAIEATVLDQQSNPVASAAVRGIGHLPPCEPPAFEPSIAGYSTTDQEGLASFDMFAVFNPPGTYCVSLVVTRSGQAPDTVGSFDVEFYPGAIPPDTSRFVAIVGGN